MSDTKPIITHVGPDSGIAGPMDNLHVQFIAAGEALVTFKTDGTLEYGPNYTPDAAAKLFWETLTSQNPLLGEVERLKAVLTNIAGGGGFSPIGGLGYVCAEMPGAAEYCDGPKCGWAACVAWQAIQADE